MPGSVTPTVELYGGGRYMEFANKSAPRKKNRNQKIEREFDATSITVEFLGLRIFF